MAEIEYINKSNNVSVFIFHFVGLTK